MSQKTAQRCGPARRCIAFAGNPNVGKSTMFNALTGMRQHTGNWPGKTVELAKGRYEYKGDSYSLWDLPGTYSLLSCSQEETVAAEFICSGQADCVVVVCDGSCLERTLLLALQIMELTDQVVLCVNLMDEARKKHITIQMEKLSQLLGVPVVATAAGKPETLHQLQETLRQVCDGSVQPHPIRTLGQEPKHFTALCGTEQGGSDRIAAQFVSRVEDIVQQVRQGEAANERDQKLDRIFMGKATGYASLCLLLLGIFWLTLQGTNYPSDLLQKGFDLLGIWLRRGMESLSAPGWLVGAVLDGIYANSARVISVMLPPMAIFFPLFTLLEDFGYLPRVAFLMDCPFARAGTCGKQALTMCMGFGCNAVGVMGCRIIDSPRERLVALLTNALVPCNGRFPGLILLLGICFAGHASSFYSALTLTGMVLLAVLVTLGVSWLLSHTVCRGEPSAFVLELPAYRRPRIGKVIVRSLFDRTLFVLGRAVTVAMPAGLLLWLLCQWQVGEVAALTFLAEKLGPVGHLLGMNGALLLAFILGFPANELVLPVAVMILSSGAALPGESAQMGQVLLSSGLGLEQLICTMVFMLFHWPCSTTVLTLYKETHSLGWTALGAALPTLVGVVLCLGIHMLWCVL